MLEKAPFFIIEKTMLTITLPKEKKFLLVGSGDPIKIFMKKIKEFLPRASVLVISEKECDEAWSIYDTRSIDSLAQKYNFSIYFPKDLNSKEAIDRVKNHGCNIGLVMGSRWILKDEIIGLFNGCLFNYHPANLPFYRGAGGYRWQVMNGERTVSITIHQLTSSIDAGPILMQQTKAIQSKDIYPEDFFINLQKLGEEIFAKFLRLISTKRKVAFRSQNNEKVTYFPLLDNAINGAIDLNWGKSDIKLFINAFGKPYSGAFLFYKRQKIHILRAQISKRRQKFHSFAQGLIINKTKDFIEVAVKDGSLIFSEMKDIGGERLPMSYFRVGDRFYVPLKILCEARTHRPSNKKFILKIDKKS